jgi:hypothetical protein
MQPMIQHSLLDDTDLLGMVIGLPIIAGIILLVVCVWVMRFK